MINNRKRSSSIWTNSEDTSWKRYLCCGGRKKITGCVKSIHAFVRHIASNHFAYIKYMDIKTKNVYPIGKCDIHEKINASQPLLVILSFDNLDYASSVGKYELFIWFVPDLDQWVKMQNDIHKLNIDNPIVIFCLSDGFDVKYVLDEVYARIDRDSEIAMMTDDPRKKQIFTAITNKNKMIDIVIE